MKRVTVLLLFLSLVSYGAMCRFVYTKVKKSEAEMDAIIADAHEITARLDSTVSTIEQDYEKLKKGSFGQFREDARDVINQKRRIK